MATNYNTIPASVKVKPTAFTANVAQQKLDHLKQLLELSPIAPAVFENTRNGRRYGTERDWLINAKNVWQKDFDWRKWEDRINSYPNYSMSISDDEGTTIDMHFIALFSKRSDAIPIAFYHGWPGSFLEFLDLIDLLKNKYRPDELPYHVIVPSLPGYAYSSGPPVDVDYTTQKVAKCMDKLMINLGFESGYLAQGGDVGSAVAKWQAVSCESCKGIHLNMFGMKKPEDTSGLPVDEIEQRALDRRQRFVDNGTAYIQMQETRTATLGLAISASPLALLSWVGEKWLDWSDEDPPLDHILANVTLWWVTDTFQRSLYPYRGTGSRGIGFIEKPVGYSLFPNELLSQPKSWIEKSANLVHYSQHSSGGHFAAMEKPQELLADVEEWVKKVWKEPKSSL